MFQIRRDKVGRGKGKCAHRAWKPFSGSKRLPESRGFPARSFIKVGEDEQPKDGEWHLTPDGKWSWKGDTSSDEIVGHYFVYPIYYDLVATDDEKKKIKGVVERITSHIVDNKFQLIDLDGKPTRWGWWGPDEIWKDADETGLRALHLLSHLRVASYITRDQKFERIYRDLIETHRYHLSDAQPENSCSGAR